MKYGNTVRARFVDRPNRFVAHVELDGALHTVHVKNTGRCKELLVPGAEVTLQRAGNPARKTAFDLISVYKNSRGWVNIDSQAPNAVVFEWLRSQDFDLVKPEYALGGSRFDFYLERTAPGHSHLSQSAPGMPALPHGQEPATQRILMEVKGCTLEIDGVGFFPDAPTERGVKHLRELTSLAGMGYACYLAFVIAMPGVTEVRPNLATHPTFGEALAEAQAAGVNVLHLPCEVSADELRISAPALSEAGRVET